MTDRRKLMTATLLGVAIALIKGPFQWPITDYLIIVEAPILGLSFLLLGRGGATYTGLVNGLLQSAVKVNFFPLDLVFGVSYGVLVDLFGTLLRARTGETTSIKRMTLALGLASTIAGLSIAYAVIALNINLGPVTSSLTASQLVNLVYIPIIIWGVLSGTLGGFIAAKVWDKNLKARFRPVQSPVS
ncbi:MAG: hypothetical protein HY296_05355 [Thaumarchaeota archaeon]|nr:hypothetical protein [Nitrososphaerota archaeon]